MLVFRRLLRTNLKLLLPLAGIATKIQPTFSGAARLQQVEWRNPVLTREILIKNNSFTDSFPNL